jgi:toxin ParE1/3/4
LQIRFTKPSERDLSSIEEYISQENPAAAIRTVLRILNAIEGLAMFPDMGRPGRVLGTRELVISGTPYIAVYKVRDYTIWILRVLHGRMRWPK